MATWTDLVHKFLGHAKYNATLPTYTDGQTAEAQADSRGRLIVAPAQPATSSTAGTAWVDSVGALTHRNLVTATANKALMFVLAQSSYGTAGYLQFHNLSAVASLVSGTSQPVFSVYLPANGTASLDLPRGRVFSTGIVWAFSSTAGVYTQDASATVLVNAEIA